MNRQAGSLTHFIKQAPRLLKRIAGAENRNDSYLWWREKFSWDGKNGPAVEGFNLWSGGVLGRALIAHGDCRPGAFSEDGFLTSALFVQ